MQDYSNDKVWKKTVVSVGTLGSFVVEVEHLKGACRRATIVVPFHKIPSHQHDKVVVGAQPQWIDNGVEGFDLEFGNDGGWWEKTKEWFP